MEVLRTRIIDHIKRHGINHLCHCTGFKEPFIQSIVHGRHCKYRRASIDILYNFFHLPQDDWYRENIKKWIKPTESVLGEILRRRRLDLCLSIEQVSNKIHSGVRQIARIEAGDSLPAYKSDIIQSMLFLYGFNKEEMAEIEIFMTSLRTLIQRHKILD